MQFNNMDFLQYVIAISNAHKSAFVAIARQQKVVIFVRATGPTRHGLLYDGCDTKGYRIQGKSCNWGPMAGFVMRAPRLNRSATPGRPITAASMPRRSATTMMARVGEPPSWRRVVVPEWYNAK